MLTVATKRRGRRTSDYKPFSGYCKISQSTDELHSEMDEVLLSREFAIFNATSDEFYRIVAKSIGINVIRVDLVVFFTFARHIVLVFVGSRSACFVSRILPNLTCPVNMRKCAFVLVANPAVGIIRAFISMAFFAFGTPRTVT